MRYHCEKPPNFTAINEHYLYEDSEEDDGDGGGEEMALGEVGRL